MRKLKAPPLMLAIHKSSSGFHPYWEAYCEQQAIPFKRVDCHATDIVDQLSGCSGLLWHHSQNNPKDLLVAKQILFALEHSGFQVFPNFHTGWHFDDKVAQKYLFEALDLPAVPTWVFLDRDDALTWAASTTYPKVFKLRRGAGSANVRLVANQRQAKSLIRRAFGRGFRTYDPWGSLKERAYKSRIGQGSCLDLLKGLARFIVPPPYARLQGPERGYAYFQDFIPGNDSDIRIIVIGNRAFAIKRMTRPGDFRASGSGRIVYDPPEIDNGCIEMAFRVNRPIKSDCLACDFVHGPDGKPLLVEISYGFAKGGYDSCPGYWTEELNYVEGPFDPQGWMVEQLVGGDMGGNQKLDTTQDPPDHT